MAAQPTAGREAPRSARPPGEAPQPDAAHAFPDLPTLPTVGASPCQTHACSACCHDTEMLLTEGDMQRLRAATGRDDWWFEAEDGFLQLRVSDRPPVPGHTGKPCVFLDATGSCTVRPARPEGCRLYPAVWDGLAVLDAEHCPHTEGFLLPRWADRAVGSLAERLLAERDARAQP